jgi:hypothetical protein
MGPPPDKAFGNMYNCHLLDEAMSQIEAFNLYGGCYSVVLGDKRHLVVSDPGNSAICEIRLTKFQI